MLFLEKKNWFLHPISNIILLIMPLLPFIVGSKVQWIVGAALLFLIIFERKMVCTAKKFGWIVMLLIPTAWSFFYSINGNNHEIVQSLFYLLTPFLMLCSGLQIGGLIKNKNNLYKYIIYSGTLGSLAFLLIGIVTLGMSAFSDIYKIRHLLGWTSITNIITVIILLFGKRYSINLFTNKTKRNVLLFINVLALILMASRTYYIMFLVFVILFVFNYKKTWFFTLAIILLTAFLILLSVKSENLMIIKLQNSFSEISNTERFAGYDNINAYYRAYETQQAMKTYYTGNDFELLLGHGLEKKVDLGSFVELAGAYWRYIPVLHNGYMYLLLRCGFLGALFYFLFFLRTFLMKNSSSDGKFLTILNRGVILSLITSNYVITSFFSPELIFAWMLIGVFFHFTSKGLSLE